MKHAAFFLLLCLTSCKRSFEGKITCVSNFTNKKDNTTNKTLNERLGTQQDIFIAGSNFLTTNNGSFLKSQIYQGSTNKVFTRFNNDSLYWKNCDVSSDTPIKYEAINGSKNDTVLGMLCDILIVYTKKSKTTYYYNNKYFVDPETFKNLNYENRYFLFSKMKAFPLKSVYETSDWILTTTITKITPKTLDAKIFDLGDTSKLAPFDHIRFLRP